MLRNNSKVKDISITELEWKTYPDSSRISGATYVGVPHTKNIGDFTSTANPKSASFTDFVPKTVSKT